MRAKAVEGLQLAAVEPGQHERHLVGSEQLSNLIDDSPRDGGLAVLCEHLLPDLTVDVNGEGVAAGRNLLNLGAAVATLVSEVALFALLFSSMQKLYPQRIIKLVSTPALLSCVVAFVVWFLKDHMNFLMQIVAGGLAGLALVLALVLLRYLKVDEVLILGGKEEAL